MESLFLLLVILFHDAFSQQCPPGYSALYNNNQLVTCSFSNVCSCQSIRPGYFCQYSSTGQNICCGVSATQCPTSSAILSTNGNGYQSCQNSNDCPASSYCNQNVCCASPNAQCGNTGGGNCANGQVLVNGICMNQVGPGSSCQNSQQCTGGSQCSNGFCQCPNGAQPTNGQCQNSGGNTGSNGQCIFGAVLVNNQCISMTPPGSQCTNSQQCLDNSSCSFNFGTSGICTCTNNLQQLTAYLPYCVSATNTGQCPNSQTVMVNGQCRQYGSLNSNCISDVQCLGGSRCQSSTCQCPMNTQSLCFTNNGQQQCYCITPNSQNGQCQIGQVLVNGQCVTASQIGSYCQSSQYCAGNSQCINNFCQCPSGTTQQGNQCIGGSSNCQSNQVLINGQCYVSIGSFGCSFSQACAGNSQCSNGQCLCPSGTTQQGNQCVNGGNNGFCPTNQVMVNGQCYVQIGSYGCTFSLGCAGNAQCSNGQCLCPSGTTQQGNQCVNGGNNGFCQGNQVLINNQCYQTVSLGSYGCTYTQQCLGNSACQNGMCQCPVGTTQQGNQCIGGNTNNCPSNQISMNNQCYTAYQPASTGCSITAMLSTCLDNSICSNNQCICQSNTQPSQGYCLPQSTGFCGSNGVMVNNQCFQLSRIDQQCTYDQQCLGGSNCMNSVCSCSQYKTRFCMTSSSFSQACYCVTSSQQNQIPIGSYCTFGQTCAGNSTCLNSYCTCPQGTTQQGSQCVSQNSQMAAPGAYCYSGQQCLDGASCFQNNCTCSNGGIALYGYCLSFKTDSCSQTMIMVNGQCLSYTTYGGQCQANQQCLGGTICTSGQCRCSNNAQPTCINGNNGQQCYCTSGTSNGIPIGSYGCSFNQPCAGNAQCFNGQCLCPSGTTQQGNQCGGNNGCQNGQVSINGQCYPTYNPNNYGCTYTQQCLGNSQCYNSYCSCPSGTTLQNNQCLNSGGNSCKSYQILINNQCLDTVGIGMQCQSPYQCTVSNTVCSGTCVCTSGMTYNGSGCSFSNIQCPSGQVLVSNSCRSMVALNQACQVSAQCLGYGTCTNSFCQCMSGTSPVNGVCRSSTETGPCNSNQVLIGNQCYNTVPLRQSCMFTQQCQGNGTCQNSICACQSPAQDYGDGICRGSSSNGDLCSAGETPQYQNNQLINCLISACPSSSYCKYNSRSSQYVCCRPGSATLTCANPQYTVLYQNNQPVNCLMTTCPSNSICEYNSSSGQYVCCQAGGSSTSTCQGNYYTYPSGFPAVCTSDTFCSSSSPTYRYCRMAPGQTFSVCCDRS